MSRKQPPLDQAVLHAAATALAAREQLPRAELAGLARAVCAHLALVHPGRSIEVRVPPFAAVQLGLDDAGAHRRGTPPNVVELPAETLIALAAGTLTWAAARETRLVSASGLRSDLSEVFPLLSTDDSSPTGFAQVRE